MHVTYSDVKKAAESAKEHEGGYRYVLVVLDAGDTCENPASTKEYSGLLGPLSVVWEIHPSGVTAFTYNTVDEAVENHGILQDGGARIPDFVTVPSYLFLDEDSERSLERRKDVGEKCISAAAGRGMAVDGEEDREMFASDAISAILTALYGPAGVNRRSFDESGDEVDLKYEGHLDHQEQARALMARALDSWYGDAEDYSYSVEHGTEPID